MPAAARRASCSTCPRRTPRASKWNSARRRSAASICRSPAATSPPSSTRRSPTARWRAVDRHPRRQSPADACPSSRWPRPRPTASASATMQRMVRLGAASSTSATATPSRRTRKITRAPSSTATTSAAFPPAAGTTINLKLPSLQSGQSVGRARVRRGLDLILYANNLFDENPRLSFDRERGGRARLGFNIGQPRTIGLTIRQAFSVGPAGRSGRRGRAAARRRRPRRPRPAPTDR